MPEQYPVKWYHECREILEVEVLEQISDDKGETFKLRATGRNNGPGGFIKEEARIKEGEVFTAWRAHHAGANAGWYLLDHS